MSRIKMENKKITFYGKYLVEHSRPPSKGGNTNALHTHVLEIDGEKYSFFALGSQQWVFKSDTVSFEYEFKDGYKKMLPESIKTLDRTGKLVSRGNHGFKTQLRTADTRMPSSRKEQRD